MPPELEENHLQYPSTMVVTRPSLLVGWQIRIWLKSLRVSTPNIACSLLLLKKDFICLKTVPAWAQLMRTCLKAGRLWRARSSRTRVPQTYEDQPYRSLSKKGGIITSKYLSHTWLHFWHSSSFSMLVFSSRAWMMWESQGISSSAKSSPGHRAFPQVCLPYPSPLCHSQRRHESWQTPRLGNVFFPPCITFSVNPKAC